MRVIVRLYWLGSLRLLRVASNALGRGSRESTFVSALSSLLKHELKRCALDIPKVYLFHFALWCLRRKMRNVSTQQPNEP